MGMATILEKTRKAPWNNIYELTFLTSSVFPPSIPTSTISCSFVLIFDKDHRLLLGKHRVRGFDIPGGHVEHGETPEEGACREVKEEVGLCLSPSDLTFFGYEHLHDPSPTPHSKKYSYPDSYFLFYVVGNIDSTKNSFVPRASTEQITEQMTETKWFTKQELIEHKWFVERPNVLDFVLQLLTHSTTPK
eukprot:TRINITY_DN20766_c0_g1_i1.p1 TRINITY_DN20766_c0_g1~~TRINITY_DN20766_c0_g1_i1.p1  ORF type:complete len:190 (-),score=42.10 TRINITY_DN20766_c0_g1_i1:9-578(-)